MVAEASSSQQILIPGRWAPRGKEELARSALRPMMAVAAVAMVLERNLDIYLLHTTNQPTNQPRHSPSFIIVQ